MSAEALTCRMREVQVPGLKVPRNNNNSINSSKLIIFIVLRNNDKSDNNYPKWLILCAHFVQMFTFGAGCSNCWKIPSEQSGSKKSLDNVSIFLVVKPSKIMFLI